MQRTVSLTGTLEVTGGGGIRQANRGDEGRARVSSLTPRGPPGGTGGGTAGGEGRRSSLVPQGGGGEARRRLSSLVVPSDGAEGAGSADTHLEGGSRR